MSLRRTWVYIQKVFFFFFRRLSFYSNAMISELSAPTLGRLFCRHLILWCYRSYLRRQDIYLQGGFVYCSLAKPPWLSTDLWLYQYINIPQRVNRDAGHRSAEHMTDGWKSIMPVWEVSTSAATIITEFQFLKISYSNQSYSDFLFCYVCLQNTEQDD